MKQRQTIPMQFEGEPVLDLHADATVIEVQPVAAGEEPRVEVEGGGAPEGRAPVKVEQRGGVVFVRLAHGWGDTWPVPFDINKLVLHVPAHVRARLHCDMGKLRVHGLAGCDLEATSNAGKIEVDQCRGRFKLAVSAGAVWGEHLGGTFDVRSDAGSVKLGIDALDDGEHLIRTAMGSVKVELASGLDARVETFTSLGTARSTYPDKPDAKATLRLEAQLGSVRVREAGAAEDPRHGDWPDWRRRWSAPFAWPQPAPAHHHRSRAEAETHEANVRRVLEMVQAGTISAAEAERLIQAMG